MSHSLNQHVQQGWRLTAANGNPMVELLPAQQRTVEHNWYSGTANAIYQNLDIIRKHQPQYVLILAGDHIYKMDYRSMLAEHEASGADLTIASTVVPSAEASNFGVLQVDEQDRVKNIPGDTDRSLVSMGIYIFNSDLLYDILQQDHQLEETQHDFGKNIIPSLTASGEPAYWRDVGTLEAFWRANLELIGVVPQLNLYDTDWPIRTFPTQSPPAKFVFDSAERCGQALNSMICDGCIISGARISNSL